MKKKLSKWIIVGIPLLLVAGAAFIVGGSYFEHKELVQQEKREYMKEEVNSMPANVQIVSEQRTYRETALGLCNEIFNSW